MEELEWIHRRKTGAMFRVSLRLGGIVGEASESQTRRAGYVWQCLGLAFQIIDDLLDVKGDEAAMGKRVGKDSDRGKLTFPGLLGIEASQERARQLIVDACQAVALLRRSRRNPWKLWRSTCWKGIANAHASYPSSSRLLICIACRWPNWSSWPARCARCCAIWWRRDRPTSHRTSASSSCAWRCTAVFDFRRDRLIWDTGHQIYPHKLITGRYHEFDTIRTKGGLMGYPNPDESEYDLFMTGHAGCSVSTVLGLAAATSSSANDDRHAVAVIGDGAFPPALSSRR